MDWQGSAVLCSAKHPDVMSAVLELVSELRPADVIRRIARTAPMLLDASCGAVAVLGPDDRVVELVEHEGGSASPPLSQLIGGTAPLGFLGTHPCALGVPIRSRRGLRANLYIAGRTDRAEFTDADEDLLSSFACVAGAVIDNAQLYEEGQQRELWVALQSQIATMLLAGVDMEDVLDVVARGARDLTEADSSTVLLYDGASSLTVRAADGQSVRLLVGDTFPADVTISGSIVKSGESLLLSDFSTAEATGEPLLCVGGIGQAIFVPLVAGGGIAGTLAVGRRAGRAPLSQTDIWLLESFASQVSVVLEYGRARAEIERLAVVEDQERIARDLHDTVIQQLFATGMSLQATAHRMVDAPAAQRVQQSVDVLDHVIRDIRAAVFALGSPVRRKGGMRATVQELAAQLSEASGLRPELHFDGPIDTAIGPGAEQHVLATLREALSNVNRHASASRVDVFLQVGPDIVVRVVDNGIGLDPRGIPGNGLANLKARAEALGGTMSTAGEPGGGTALEWRVPLQGRPPE